MKAPKILPKAAFKLLSVILESFNVAFLVPENDFEGIEVLGGFFGVN
jgi:hypothetical protein